MERVRVFAPASASNLGPGFDVLGLALQQPGDIVEAELAETIGVELVAVHGSNNLTTNPTQNVVCIAAASVLREANVSNSVGVRLWLHKKMPLASGLGSSAASSVAGALATHHLLDSKLNREQLIQCALEGEAAVSGTPHADNVAPSLLGGIVLIRSCNPLDVISLPVPSWLRIVVVHPHTTVKTSEARNLLKNQNFPIGKVVQNLGNLGAFVDALHTKNRELFGRAISDALVEPIRAHLVPAFAKVQQAALDAGGLGCSISGSGPSVFAFSDSDDGAMAVADSIQSVFSEEGFASDQYVGSVNTRGAILLTPE
tara:strand:- start:2521 stop:3462 length:942 start_codon:yes stop_codon:yes gene_type:complete